MDIKCGAIAPQDFKRKQEAYFNRIRLLRRHGLPCSIAIKLVQIWSQGAGVHIMRAAPIHEPYAAAIDEGVLQITQDILDFKEPWTEQRKLQLFTPKKHGGGGMGTMVGRMRPAWLGGWESGLAPVARTGNSLHDGAPERVASAHEDHKQV